MASWCQKTISLKGFERGFHLITPQLTAGCPEIKDYSIGLLTAFIQHTSASLTINENADPDVRTDMETAFNALVPEKWSQDGTFEHTAEGADDMPAHVKSSLLGPSVTVPITDG